MGGKRLIAIYLQNTAFDTRDEPALLTVTSRGGSIPQPTLGSVLTSLSMLCICIFFLKPRHCILREAPIQGSFFFFVIAGRPTEPPTQGHPQRESEMLIPLKKLWRNKRDSPMCLCACISFLSHHSIQNSQTKCLFAGSQAMRWPINKGARPQISSSGFNAKFALQGCKNTLTMF